MAIENKKRVFESARGQLFGLAYRLTGSISDAQDLVQDTYIIWVSYQDIVDKPIAWLVKVCTNQCLDYLKSARVKRLDDIGLRLPDYLHTEITADIEQQIEICSSLTVAFLHLLQRLSPKERAVYLLHDIFEKRFSEIADTLDLKPENCRKIASRARTFIEKEQVRYMPSENVQIKLLRELKNAIITGNLEQFSELLANESQLMADGGGKVVTIKKSIKGRIRIATFIMRVLHKVWANMSLTEQRINGQTSLVVEHCHGVNAIVNFAFENSGRVKHIFIMRNPDKLRLTHSTLSHVGECGTLLLSQK